MITILIVEDDAEKLRRITSTLCQVEGVEIQRIHDARDAMSARRLLEKQSYDLLVLDIAIPERLDKRPQLDGGLKLLEDIDSRERFRRPAHIVGITALEQAQALAERGFSRRMWTILPYSSDTDDWVEPLQARARHILDASRRKSVSGADFSSDLAILCALPIPELSNILRLEWSWKQVHIANDDTIYYEGRIPIRGAIRTVHAAASSRIGMSSASTLAMKLIATFKPRYLAMTGIAAGVRGKVALGDILVADPSWDYGSGKFEVKFDESIFLPAPYQLSLVPRMRNKLVVMAADEVALAGIRAGWAGPRPESALSMHIGPLASGASVVADAAVLEKVMAQHRKLLGIEMETYAVFSAAEEAPDPRPTAFSIKSVSDFADIEKSDDFRDYAAYTSARALEVFVREYLFAE